MEKNLQEFKVLTSWSPWQWELFIVSSVFQISEELEKVKQEMEEKGSSMSDGGETAH